MLAAVIGGLRVRARFLEDSLPSGVRTLPNWALTLQLGQLHLNLLLLLLGHLEIFYVLNFELL